MFYSADRVKKVTMVLGLAFMLNACVSTGSGSDSGQQNGTANSNTGQNVEGQQYAEPEPGLTPRQRILKAIKQLERGNAQIAKVELDEYLVSTPNSQRAKDLLRQITTPSEAYYPTEYFTVDLEFGQSISTLSKQYLGSAWQFYALAKYNQIENPSRINTGSKIKIPLTEYAQAVLEEEKSAVEASSETEKSETAEVQVETAVTQEVTAEETVPEIMPVQPETPESLIAKLSDANNSGDFAQSIVILESLRSMTELDSETERLAIEALVGRAYSLQDSDSRSASLLFGQAGDVLLKNGDVIAAFDQFKLAFETDSTNLAAEEHMSQLQQQIVNQYHREASVAFRQQKLEDAIAKWDIVLHVDPNHTNASAYRTQAIELKERLKALKN